MLRRLFIGITTLVLETAPTLALALQAPTAAQEGFRPASELPPGQQVPAAPLLVGSYAFFLVLMMFYLWTIWRRIGTVEKEMHDLERRQGAAKR
jgi:type VI protein secretion system component VasF